MFSIRRSVAALAAVGALAGVGAGVASASGPASYYQSPSGNIVCAYEYASGVACGTRNNGRVLALEAFTGRTVQLYGPITAASGRTIPYGRTIRVGGTFRITSTTAGISVRSTLTGHGFFLARERAYRF